MEEREKENRGKGSICGFATKGIAREEAGTSHQERSAGRSKKAEEGRRRRGSTHSQAMRSAARMEEELNGRVKEESRGALWKGSTGKSMPIKIRVVHRRSNSFISNL